MTASNEPATSAPAHVLAYAKANRKALNKARRVYATRQDHGHEYEGREATDHLSPVAQEIAFNGLLLDPKPTKKELQFALDFLTPIHVTDAADRWGKSIDSDAHKPPMEKRPGLNNGPRKPKRFDADAITAAVTEAGLSEKTLAKLLAKLTAPAEAVA